MPAPSKPFVISFDYTPPSRRITWPCKEHATVGGFLGAVCGITAALRHDVEVAFLLFVFLTPVLAVAGAAAGYFASRIGWRYVGPLVLALVGGAVLPIYDPH